MNPATVDALLDQVDELRSELVELKIPFRDQPGTAGLGLPRACLGHVVSFVAAFPSAAQLTSFVDRLHCLDKMVAPNQRTPRAPYRALQRVLKRWLKEHPSLEIAEWLYLLGWTQRMLPRDSQRFDKRSGGASSASQQGKGPRPSPMKDDPSIGQKKAAGKIGGHFGALGALKKKWEGG